MNTAEAKVLYDKIPKFSGRKEDVQLEELVRQIEYFADMVQWVDNEDGENGAICYLFRERLTGKADQIWRMIEEEEEINLNIWENVKRQFQMHFPAKPRPTMTKDNPKVRSEKKTKANRMPRVVQGANEEIKTFADRCRLEVGKIMSEVPNPEESQMPQVHAELSRQDKEQIKEAHLNEATETLAKTMFINGARGALKSVLVRQNPSSLTEAIQTAVQMEQKWIKVKLAKQRIQELADMEDHELEHGQRLAPQIIKQVNQRRAKNGFQPFKPSTKFPAKIVQQEEEPKNAEKETLLEHLQLSVAKLQGGAPAKTVTSSAPGASKPIKDNVSGLYQDLIVNTIAKLNASLKKPLRPYVSVQMKGHKLSALYDTGADICCMSSTAFRRVFPVGQRPEKLNRTSNVSAASGNKLEGEGIYILPMEINKRKFQYQVHIFGNLNEDMILGINFFQEHGLGYDPTMQEFYWTDCATPDWHTANLQCSESITINPTSNKWVTLNVLTESGFRIADPCEAVAAISSGEHVVRGGPALVRVNRLGQTQMEIFNCTNHAMTIEKNSILGVIEKLKDEDQVGELQVNEMTVNLEQKDLTPAAKITEKKKKYILDNVKFARNEDLTEALKQKYIALLLEHHEAISNSLFDTGRSQTVAHDIQLKKQDPIYLKQFRIPEAQREAVQKHVEELLKLGVVRPSRSKFNNPIYVVSRPDGGLRIVHDFRAINQETLLEPYSMKNIQDSMEDLSRAGSKLFSKIDLTSGFWQMFLNPDCRKYTAFTLPGIGQFEWNASPAGLVGATGSFQRLMEIVIHQLKNVLAHIDDLLVHTKDHEQQLKILDQLFIRLRKHGLTINLPESTFCLPEVEYLGFKINQEGVQPGTDHLKAIAATQPPKDVAEVRQFLGLCNFFRSHVQNFSQLTAPLTEMTKRECPWRSGPLPEPADKAYGELKTILISEPLIHHPDDKLPYALITDACQGDAVKPGGYGAILAQVRPDGQFQVIGYASR